MRQQPHESIGLISESRGLNPSIRMRARNMKLDQIMARASRRTHVLALIALIQLAIVAGAQELTFDDTNLQDDAELNFRALQKTLKTQASLTSSSPEELKRLQPSEPTIIATQLLSTNTKLSEKPTQITDELAQVTTVATATTTSASTLTAINSETKPLGDTPMSGNQTTSTLHSDVEFGSIHLSSAPNQSSPITTGVAPQREQTISASRPPVLHPSIQEEASELSRKYLNLERHKQQVAATSQATSISLPQKQSSTTANVPATATATSGDDAEQEIILKATTAANETQNLRTGQSDDQDTLTRAQAMLVGGIAANSDGQYLQIDTATASRLSAQTGMSALNKRPVSSKRKKANQKQQRRLAQLQQDQLDSLDNDDIELSQCQRYLQKHSTAYQAMTNSAESPMIAGNRLSYSAGQLLPCTCQQTSGHFASNSFDPQLGRLESLLDFGQPARVWLNCDRIQLIGSQLFTQVDTQQRLTPATNSNQSRSMDGMDNSNSSNFANDDDEIGDNLLTRFSQREAGLQVLFSQKFHYLQLSNLRSIDLSQNRLRRIKMDAFHGLESTLEYLNLAQNLLGDSRAMFASAISEQKSIAPETGEIGSNNPMPHAADGDRAQDSLRTPEHNSNNQLIFISELNRLKKLKWLSLQGNQITQLAASVFYQPPPSQHHHHSQFYHGQDSENKRDSSELLYLDLSDNLLKSVPSVAVQFLEKLQVLKLNRNKIIQLDQSSKFPTNLKHLDLSDNLISVVRRCDLIDLPHLVELDLSNNQLRHLDQTAFVSANSLVAPTGSVAFVPNSQQTADEASDTSGSARSQSKVVPDDSRDIGQQQALLHEQLLSLDAAGHSTRIRREISQDGAEPSEDAGEILEAEESRTIESESDPSDDLETDESIFSAITSRLKGSAQQVLSEGPSVNHPISQFNSTLRLNLSFNFFEDIPGDSLLKFSKLRSLDLSYNKIQELDSNYLCSIYNLVENLRYLDLSGNLLSLNQRTVSASDNQRHLNKLFGCLQRLETLMLSRNRLVSAIAVSKSELSPPENNSRPVGTPTRSETEADFDFIRTDDNHHHVTSRREDVEPTRVVNQNNRLVIKFGDNHGSKQLHTLDLSDNQLRLFPQIVLATNPLVSAPKFQAATKTNDSAANRAQLDQWMNSRLRLEVLNLGYNYLERLDASDLDHLHNIRILNLDFNKLTTLPAKVMKRFSSLEELSLAGNRINSLEPVHELFERSVRTLRVLNLSNNRLMIWPPAAVQSTTFGNSNNNHNNPEYKTSGGYSSRDLGISLEYEVASNSKRQQVPIDLALEELNLEGNLLTSINVTSLFDQLIYMKSLRRLDLSYNLLNKVQSEWFKFANKNLQRLLLTGNKINSIDLGAFALNQVNELVQLNLDFNLLKELKRKTFESMPKIRELSLAHNLIHTINSETFHQLNSLQVLNLSNNKLTSWKCEYFSHLCNSISGNINVDLATLIASHQRKHEEKPLALHSGGNQLPAVGQQQVSTPTNGAISSLVELDLSHNSISQLRANSISVHTILTRLDLSHNKLSFIPHDLFKATTSILSGGRQVHLVSSLKWLNLAHNRIQTIDNINFKPLMNLQTLDLSFNELQSLGVDVIALDAHNSNQESATRRVFVGNNLTSLLMDEDTPPSHQRNQTNARSPRSLYSSSSWPALSKLRHLNLSHNTLTLVNQSLLSELSPFVALNLDLSYNYLDSEQLPMGFFTKVSSLSRNAETTSQQQPAGGQAETFKQAPSESGRTNYDLIFTLKIESLDLSHNRLSEWPGSILDNHHASMESCNLSHNRIQNLPQNSNPMIQMKSLNLEFNPLSRDSSEMVLAEQKSARQLNLAATRLYAIQQASAEGAQYSSSMPNMRMRLVNQTSQLDLIRSISKPIEGPYLRHLNLSSNQLVWLAANVFERMHSLQTLDLSNNQLTRLHLLSNQLNQVSGSLEYLYLGSNLFTSVDSTDFNQLSRIRLLDLSNLLSLQKLNCRFLAKLSTLRKLMMFNYPQLRQRLINLVASLHSDDQLTTSERYQLKLRDELVMSTIGSHCFQDTAKLAGLPAEGFSGVSEQSWFKLEQIELELFNNFQNSNSANHGQASFQLTNELRQLLGSQTKRLSLVGLNLTSISDDSLLGITSDNLDLKISYTSLSHVPLKQILTSLTKRTKLKLDLRNNNIQSIDMEALQWFDELQQISQTSVGDHSPRGAASDPESSSSLRLASNPFKCDCQTRPLWLWLNQRWGYIDLGQISQINDDQIGETSTANSANYWLKFHTVSQANDIKCFYPAKLRGRLAQHVYYNDLVCKGPPPSQASGQSQNTGQKSRKRPEAARSSDSYYLTSQNDFAEMDDLDEEDYFDVPSSNPSDLPVKITRFNRYPPVTTNSTSMYFLTNFPTIPLIPDKQELPIVDDNIAASNRIGKRDHHGQRGPSMSSASPDSSLARERSAEFLINTKNSKYKPNIQQKHSAFDTLTTLNSVKFGRSGIGRQNVGASYMGRQSILTESDVLILTVASIAMTVMFFVIMGVCLFKYRMDRTEEEQILSTHSKLIMSRAFFTNRTEVPMGHSTSDSSSSSSSQDQSPDASKPFGASQKSNRRASKGDNANQTKVMQLGLTDQKTQNNILASTTHPMSSYLSKGQKAPPTLLAPGAHNFLMRSPTIRRMHGLAGNASDWFKYTLKAYPSASGSRRRRLFIQNSGVCGGPSQLSTSRPIRTYIPQRLALAAAAAKSSDINSISIQSVCPSHGLKVLNGSTDHVEDCPHCSRLLAKFQQIKYANQKSVSTGEVAGAGAKDQPVCGADPNENLSVGIQATTNVVAGTSSASFQTIIEQGDGGFMPPKMIKALAQRLDEQATGKHIGTHPKLYTRDQQVRAMRTFGHHRQEGNRIEPKLPLANESNTIAVGCTKSNGPLDGAQSQIPTIDVDGRFAYQSDSNVDSQHGYDIRVDTRGGITPASTVATNQDDIFILVRDTPTSDTARESVSTCRNGMSRGRNHNLETGSQMTTMTTDYQSSAMNDECSRSSSPIAYGFMRSSPSGTTLSSNTFTAHHQRSSHMIDQPGESMSRFRDPTARAVVADRRNLASKTDDKNQWTKMSNKSDSTDKATFDDNNNNNYANAKFLKSQRQTDMISEVSQEARTSVQHFQNRSFGQTREVRETGGDHAGNGQDQIIISRL